MNTKSNSIFQFRKSIKQFVLVSALLWSAISYVPAQNSKNTEKFDGYLFAYFEGSGKGREQEQIRFAVSENAVNWFALNQNQPVLRSEAISQTGGVRDPHILRGEDGKSFYMVATDMFTHRNGWDNNPGIVMLKSDNLLDWKHSIIGLEKLYPKKFKNVKWVWRHVCLMITIIGICLK